MNHLRLKPRSSVVLFILSPEFCFAKIRPPHTMGNQSSRGGASSESTTLSDVTDSERSSTKLPSLHGNLMRSQHKRDPMKCVRQRNKLDMPTYYIHCMKRFAFSTLSACCTLYDMILTQFLIVHSFRTNEMELIDYMKLSSILVKVVWVLFPKLENVIRRSGGLLDPNSWTIRNAAFDSFPFADPCNRKSPSLKTFPKTTTVQ